MKNVEVLSGGWKMKKVLFVATVVRTHIEVFHLPYLKWFKENGYETHVCAKNDYYDKEECNISYCDKYYDLPFERSPIQFNNLKVFKQLTRIIEENKYDIIHCHTPMGGALTRLAVQKSNVDTKVIYTAHGFHFFKGAPIKNWLLYYPIELWLSKYTDVLININKEDYNRAKASFRAKNTEYISGVGIDIKKFERITINKPQKRKEIGIPENGTVLLSVGELNSNKNHEVVVRALSKLDNKNLYYVICGQGPLEGKLKKLIKGLKIESQVKLLGFRKDIVELCGSSDIFVFPSKREGLPLALMEAMASGLPVVCSNIRGNSDLIESNRGGCLVNSNDVDGYYEAIKKIVENQKIKDSFGAYNKKTINKYSLEEVMIDIEKIYSEV